MRILFIYILIISFSYADLHKPSDGENLRYIHILFEWDQEPNAISYNLQASTGQSFNNIILNIEEETTVYIDTENLDWNETYYWRVRPIYNSSDFGDWTEISNFSIGEIFFIQPLDHINQDVALFVY